MAFSWFGYAKNDKGGTEKNLGEIYNLTVDNVECPVGVDHPTPLFSWKTRSDKTGWTQTAYQLVVKSGNMTVWDSGKVKSNNSVSIEYGGKTLTSSTEYDWFIKVWDKDNEILTASSNFETGLLGEHDFEGANFISVDNTNAKVTDYTIDLDFIIDSCNQGFCFGMQGNDSFYMWQVNVSERSGRVLLRPHIKRNGDRTVTPAKGVDATDITAAVGDYTKPVHERIEVRGRTVKTYFGANEKELKLVSIYTGTEDIPLGKIGFRHCSHPGAVPEIARYDNIVVKSDGNTLFSYDFEGSETGFSGNRYAALDGGMLKVGTLDIVGEQIYTQTLGNDTSVFRKSFFPLEKIVFAKLYASGLGVFESYLNGERIGRRLPDGRIRYDELKPGSNEMGDRKMYYSYDVTRMLSAGKENVLSAMVTSGWWTGRVARRWGKQVAYWAKLVITYENGARDVIATDETWRSSAESPLLFADIYDGETYDARVSTEWMKPGYDDSLWCRVNVNTEFTGKLVSGYSATIVVRDDLERTVQSVKIHKGIVGASDTHYGRANVVRTLRSGAFTLNEGETAVIDFGQNFAGREAFAVKGARGTKITVKHAEMLNDGNGAHERGNDGPEGTVYQAALRSALATTNYILSGEGIEEYHPSHTYYGFRYIQITADAPVTFHKLTGQVVTSVERDTGYVNTSNEEINRLFSNVRWGQYSNYLSVPSDCPQRDERLGWTADTQVFAQTGLYLGDNKNFLRKFMTDMSDAQREDGAIPGTVPTGQYGGDSTYWSGTGWADAAVIVPYRLYTMYGDPSVIEENWETMTKWMGYLAATNKLGGGRQWGDHLAFEANDSEVREQLGVIYYAWDAMMMAEMADAVGKSEEANDYRLIYRQEKEFFITRYVKSDGTLKRRVQTLCLYALYLDLLPDAQSVAAVTKQLVTNIENNGNKLGTGFLGTAIILPALTKIGRSDVAYTLLLQRNNPSWLYSVAQGATTTWERWDSYTLEKGFGDASMNSFNHYAYGAVAGWMFSSMAGIGYDSEHVGFKHIIFAPHPDMRIQSAKAAYESAFGLIRAKSFFEGTVWKYEASVPANTTARFELPVSKGASLTVNGKTIGQLALETDGIIYLGVEDGIARFEAASGVFRFERA